MWESVCVGESLWERHLAPQATQQPGLPLATTMVWAQEAAAAAAEAEGDYMFAFRGF